MYPKKAKSQESSRAPSDSSFGALSRSLFYAGLLVDRVVEEDIQGVQELLSLHGARSDLVVPERGVAALHILAGMENEIFSAEAAEAALLRGAEVDVLSEEGLAPVHVAAMWGRSRIMQILLTNGADPYLKDSLYQLTPSEHALKERKYHTYNIILTYVVILEDPGRFEKYMDDEVNTSSVTKKEESHSVASSASDKWDEIDKRGMWELDNKAKSMILAQRRKTKVYESFAEDETNDDESTSSIKEKRKSNSKLSKSKFRNLNNKLNKINNNKITDYKTKYLTDDSFDASSVNKCDKSSSSSFKMEIPTWITKEKKHTKYEADSTTGERCRGHCRDENDVYVCEFAESRFKSRTKGTTSESVVSGFASHRSANSRALCKMSRIFLFMLRKNHVYEKVK